MIRLPAIGIGRSTRQVPLTDSEIKILRVIRFDHYRIDLYLFNPDWKPNAEVATSESEKLGYSLEFALFFDDNFEYELAQFIFWIKNKKTDTALISLFHKSYPTTPGAIINKIYTILKNALPDVKVGSGTNANFAQLNRNRPESVHPCYICYSIHPQEHASDNATLVENLQAQSYTVESAIQLAHGRDIWISPVNIQRRYNANIENYEQLSNRVDCPPQIDSRQMSLFGACWTAGSLKYLSEAAIKGVTFFETVGERGIFQGDYPSCWPENFQSTKGMIFPLYHIFNYILKNKSFKLIYSNSSHPLKVDSLFLSDGSKMKLILINFTSEQQPVVLDGYPGRYTYKIIQLNDESFANAISNTDWIESSGKIIIHPDEQFLLSPFSVNFIDREF
jgi:hypothetical protein